MAKTENEKTYAKDAYGTQSCGSTITKCNTHKPQTRRYNSVCSMLLISRASLEPTGHRETTLWMQRWTVCHCLGGKKQKKIETIEYNSSGGYYKKKNATTCNHSPHEKKVSTGSIAKCAQRIKHSLIRRAIDHVAAYSTLINNMDAFTGLPHVQSPTSVYQH